MPRDQATQRRQGLWLQPSQQRRGTTTRVSVATGGAEANGQSFGPSISADGRYVAFHSFASNLVAADTNATYDVFVHDRQVGATTRVSLTTGGAEGSRSRR